MPEQARVETRATWNDVDLTNGIRTSQNKLQEFERNVGMVFRRTGSIRAERAIERFSEALAAGDIPGALAAITSRVTGLGLAAGVGFALAGAAVVKFVQDIIGMDKAISNVRDKLAIPEKIVAGLSVEGVKTQISDLGKEVDALAAKRSTFSHFIEGLIPGPDVVTSIQDLLGMFQEKQGANRIADYYQDAAKAEQNLTSAKRQSLMVDADAGARSERDLKLQQELSKIETERISRAKEIRDSKRSDLEKETDTKASDTFAATQKKEAEERKKLDDADSGRKRQLRDMEFESQERIAAIAAAGIPAEMKKTETIQERIAFLEKELGLTTEITERAKLQSQLRSARGELSGAQQQQDVDRFKPIFEKSMLSLQEVANLSKPGVASNFGTQASAQLSKQALREEELGQRAKARGDIGEAFEHFMREERIKSQIPELSDKEKMPEYAFKSALGRTEELLAAINESIQGKPQIDFLNK